MGIKPLYYWCLPNDGGVVFASEIKAFFSLPGFRASVNRESLSQYLEFGYTFNQSATILQGLNKLPPGHWLEQRKGKGMVVRRYYHPDIVRSSKQDRSLLEEKLYLALDEVIQEQLVADVPVGVLLSGGIDSSIIAAMASHHADVFLPQLSPPPQNHSRLHLEFANPSDLQSS